MVMQAIDKPKRTVEFTFSVRQASKRDCSS
jgi:hypothetical protein